MVVRCLAVVLLSVASLTSAAQAEPLAIGVQTHFAFEPPRTDVQAFRSWISRSGFASSRDEMFWSQVEDRSRSLALRDGALRTREVWASMPGSFAGLLTLDFGHPNYDAGGQPKSDQGRDAFARYADYVASQSERYVRWVEVWNEWNHVSPAERELGHGESKNYVDLARTTYLRLKAGHPGILVLTGSAGDDLPDWRWMRQVISQGLLSHTDGVAVHLYNHCMRAERVGSDELAERLDALHGIVSAAGYPNMPLYVTEVGWPTHLGSCGITEAAAAVHSLRFLLEASVRPWVAGVWFYELQDGGDDPANQEHRFGLLRRDGTEKPAGCALREIGARIAQRPSAVFRGKASATAVFRNGNSDRLLLWTRGKVTRTVTLKLESTTGHASSFTSQALCGLPAADIQVEPQGRFAMVRMAPRGVYAVDVPAGEPYTVEEFQ